jgi:hypothetical protein
VDRLGIYAPVAPVLREALARRKTAQITDLGSGNGGPLRSLVQRGALPAVDILLTDLYPSSDGTAEGEMRWHSDPVNAMEGDPPGEGVVTLFNAFHHFTAAQQRELIRLHAPRGVLVFEVLQPTLTTFLKILLTTTIGQLLLAPFVRPFRWERLLFTYLLPINLITIPWDGLVSVLRSSHPNTLGERLRSAVPAGYVIDAGTLGPWWAPVTWVRCLPENSK